MATTVIKSSSTRDEIQVNPFDRYAELELTMKDNTGEFTDFTTYLSPNETNALVSALIKELKAINQYNPETE